MHTKTHGRELWRAKFMDRRPYNEWEERRDGARDWARAEAKRILSTHQSEPLDQKLSEELRRIIFVVENK
jgi:trimethylamine--corrinoid protein Co-methyltransferase